MQGSDDRVTISDDQTLNILGGGKIILNYAYLNILSKDSLAEGSAITLNTSDLNYSDVICSGLILNSNNSNFNMNSGTLTLLADSSVSDNTVVNLQSGKLRRKTFHQQVSIMLLLHGHILNQIIKPLLEQHIPL